MKRIAMAEVRSTFSLRPGDSAPAFRLPAPDGAMHDLQEIRGTEGLLVIFACNHCPFVIHLAAEVASLAREIGASGVKTVAISSNDISRYPQDAPEHMSSFATEYGWDFPYLFDETQAVAKAYSAACTPDFFLFDSELRLYYSGQFDDSRPKSGTPVTGADLRAAVKSMLAGEPAPERPYPSSGCSIKWKIGSEPSWFAPR
ncbi:thioredoxin family protein [Luteolibacter flavescens]|uniref:Thioredoxin family protein n=1 Tax=Luteolibacter flavescens TaxID=1859460 RepID=A0ABT3FTC0_9BACT|nr:thioredoxin family protein [Luteolibacter flavescens]MCW1886828.1 thioredoxin family protein [Luteolibacter flavescens]